MPEEFVVEETTQELGIKPPVTTLVCRDENDVLYMPLRVNVLSFIAKLSKVLGAHENVMLCNNVISSTLVLFLKRGLMFESFTQASMRNVAISSVQRAVDVSSGQLLSSIKADTIVTWVLNNLTRELGETIPWLVESFFGIREDAVLSDCHGIYLASGYIVLYVPMREREQNLHRHTSIQEHMLAVANNPQRGTFMNYK